LLLKEADQVIPRICVDNRYVQVSPRQEQAYQLKQQGKTAHEIAKMMGITSAGVNRLIRLARQNKALLKDPRFAELSLRAAQFLVRMGLRGKREIAQAVRDGRILHERGCGEQSYLEICHWVGVQPAGKVPQSDTLRLNWIEDHWQTIKRKGKTWYAGDGRGKTLRQAVDDAMK